MQGQRSCVPEGRRQRRPFALSRSTGWRSSITRPIAALTDQLFPGKGAELTNLWRVKQFDYQWLSALAGRYQDFQKLTDAALVFAARALKVDLAPRTRERLGHAWLELEGWPDVAPALRSLKEAGLRLAPLANFTPAILESAAANSGLEGVFDHSISTDRARTFKPDPKAYQLGVDAFGLRREQIVFVASAGWDAAGARWFGYPTFWVNRTGALPEELAVHAGGTGSGMSDLVAFMHPGAGAR
ncbi:MAG: haloacid dehalogenase type II [Myxococcales bacterium]